MDKEREYNGIIIMVTFFFHVSSEDLWIHNL